jgi:hypothetical protein
MTTLAARFRCQGMVKRKTSIFRFYGLAAHAPRPRRELVVLREAAPFAGNEPFMGSGTTLIAAETTGRVCYGIELNPAYIDVAIERWQAFSGEKAVLAEEDRAFEDLKTARKAA